MFTLRDFTSSVYLKLGNIDTKQLSLPVLMETMYTTINRLLVELNLSTQNWLLKNTVITNPDDGIYLIHEEDFGTPVMVEIAESELGNFRPIEIINFTNVMLARQDDKLAAAFYTDVNTNQKRLVLTGQRPNSVIRVWYEPETGIPRRMETEPAIPALFKDYVTSEVAMFCLAYVNYEGDAATQERKRSNLYSSLSLQVAKWTDLWETQINRAKTSSVVTRRPFRAGL